MHGLDPTSLNIGVGLHETVVLGDLSRAIEMANAGADPHQLNSHGLSAGQWACGFHGPETLAQLQALGWMSTHDEGWMRDAGRFAISGDNAPALEWLIDRGYGPDACVVPQTLWSGMALAANTLSIGCLNVLAAAGANAHATDKMGQGLIHMMASTTRRDIPPQQVLATLEKLLSLDLDINLRDVISGDTPAAIAAFSHNLGILCSMHEHGANLHTRNSSDYGLIHAACQGSPDPVSRDVIAYLLDRGVDPDTPGVTHPVQFAAARNNPHALGALALAGVCLEVPLCDDQAQTPVYTAMCSASTEALRFLVDAGVRCDVVDRRGCGLLHLACGQHRISRPGMIQTMRELVMAKGVDPDMSSKSHQTPLLRAAQEGSCAAMQTMLDLGASATAVCLEARNLLHHVAQQPDTGPAHLAVSVIPVAYRSQPDVHGRLPHELAYLLGHNEVGYVLEAAWSSSGLSDETDAVPPGNNPQRRI